MLVRLLLAFACSFAARAAIAQDTSAGTLMLAAGESVPGDVVALRDGTLTIKSDESPSAEYAADQWLRWNHLQPPAARPRVLFAQQSQLVAKTDWTGQVPIRIDGDLVTVASACVGEVSLAREAVRCVLLEAAKEPVLAQRLTAEADAPATDDRVWLVEGDLLVGRVLSFDGTMLEFDFAGQTTSLLASSIAAVALAGEQPAETQPADYLIGFEDGSVLEADELELSSGKLSLRASGVSLVDKSASQLVYLQRLAGVTYLSDLEPVDFKHTPYFTIAWPLARDQALAGGVLTAGGQRYAKGLAMHSAARAVYRVPEGATSLAGELAIDDSAGGGGSAVFRVYRVTAEGLESAFESDIVRGGEAPQPVTVDVTGATAVVLVVDYADYGDQQDHADWLDARFVRER